MCLGDARRLSLISFMPYWIEKTVSREEGLDAGEI